MPYNYFHCSRHNPLTRYAAAQPNNMPGVYASPSCETCGKPMQFYGTGTSPTDTSAVPPPLPQPYVVPNAQTAANTLYTGVGINPGHGRVTWTISQNEAKLSMTVDLKLGEFVGGSYHSEQKFKMVDGLLDIKHVEILDSPPNKYADFTVENSRNLLISERLPRHPGAVLVGDAARAV